MVVREFGGPEVLTVTDGPQPQPGPGQVLVDVAGAGVNFPDRLNVAGTYQTKPEQPFVRHHAAEELNFQLTLVIAYVASFVLMLACVGFITFVVVWIMNLVFPILAAVAANRGEWYRYPINIRMVSGAVG